MLEYRFKNLTIKCGGEDYLVNGTGYYTIEDYDEDGRESVFETVKLMDALGKDGYINSPECLGYIEEATVAHLNNDSYLCRTLGFKV